jgi:hypothetical protein
MNSNDTVWGFPGTTLSVDASLINSSANSVLIKLGRLQNNMPGGWASSMCANICYTSSTDTAVISVAAGATQQFHFYFYTDTVPNIGHGRIGFQNVNNPGNSFIRNFYGVTSMTGIAEHAMQAHKLSIYPVPVADELSLVTDWEIQEAVICDITGRPVMMASDPQIPVEHLPAGYYFVKAFDGKGNYAIGKFIKANR